MYSVVVEFHNHSGSRVIASMNTDNVRDYDIRCHSCVNFISDAQLRICCTLCKQYYHETCCSYDPTEMINLDTWCCHNCLISSLPFSHVDAQFCTKTVNDKPVTIIDQPVRLELFSDNSTDRPLLNNSDLDPDENYYVNRPKDHGYNTPAQLASRIEWGAQNYSLMHINCRSLASKISDIQILLQSLPVDIIAVTETWMDEAQADTVQITGYTFIHKPRETGCWGGVGYLIKSNIEYEILPQLNHTSYESLLIRIPQPKYSSLTLAVIYRPPGCPLQQFNEELNQTLSDLTKTKRDIILLGDFNIDLLKHSVHGLTNNFLDTLS